MPQLQNSFIVMPADQANVLHDHASKLARTAHFGRALSCAHSLTAELMGKRDFDNRINAWISYSFNPLWAVICRGKGPGKHEEKQMEKEVSAERMKRT